MIVALTTAGLDVAGSQQQVHCVGSIWNLVVLDCAVHSGEDLVVCQCPSLQYKSRVRIALKGVMPGSARPRLPLSAFSSSSVARGVCITCASPACLPHRQHAALEPSLCLKEGNEGEGAKQALHMARACRINTLQGCYSTPQLFSQQ